MPLDVQPLSLGRRVVMGVVMVAILAGSLGLAQYMVVRAQGQPHEVRATRKVLVTPPGDDTE